MVGKNQPKIKNTGQKIQSFYRKNRLVFIFTTSFIFLQIKKFKRSWQFRLPPTCHLWKKAWKSCCSWKIFTTKKNSASSIYFRITNIFRYSTDEWKRLWNFIKTPQYFLSYRITKSTVYSLLKPSCIRETPWCKVYRCLWKWKCL